MKKLFEEFKAFISRGNVLDMAVGVVIATAFGKITTSLVNDLLMPFISWICGTRDMSALNLLVRPAEIVDGEVVRQFHRNGHRLSAHSDRGVFHNQGVQHRAQSDRKAERGGSGVRPQAYHRRASDRDSRRAEEKINTYCKRHSVLAVPFLLFYIIFISCKTT